MTTFSETVDALRALVARCEFRRAGTGDDAAELLALNEALRILASLPVHSPHTGPLVPIEAQLRCIEREIQKRREVYPRLVAAGKMSPAKSSYEIAAMLAVLQTLQLIDLNTRLL